MFCFLEESYLCISVKSTGEDKKDWDSWNNEKKIVLIICLETLLISLIESNQHCNAKYGISTLSEIHFQNCVSFFCTTRPLWNHATKIIISWLELAEWVIWIGSESVNSGCNLYKSSSRNTIYILLICLMISQKFSWAPQHFHGNHEEHVTCAAPKRPRRRQG